MPIIINSIVAIIVYKLKILNKMGTVWAFAIGCILLFYNSNAYIILLSFLTIESIIEKIIMEKESREARTKEQVICNSIMAIIALAFDYFAKDNKYYIIYTSLISCSLGDSIASTIGNKYAKSVYSVTSLKKVDRGISGGISIIGTLCGFIGNLSVAIIYFTLCSLDGKIEYKSSLIVVICGFLGMVMDSILGDLFQKKYYCSKCKRNVDGKVCCGENTKIIGGILTNNLVNLISTIITFAITWMALRI